MKRYAFLPIATLLAAYPCLPVAAQSVQNIDDCGKARDPARCLGLQQARSACHEKYGRDKRACISAGLPPPDCQNAADPQRCEERSKSQAKSGQ